MTRAQKKELKNAVKEVGAKSYKKLGDWDGKQVFLLNFSRNPFKRHIVGMPVLISFDGNEFTLVSNDKVIDFMNGICMNTEE